MLDIYGVGILVTALLAIVFLIREEKEKALISFIIFLAIMLLKFMGI